MCRGSSSCTCGFTDTARASGPTPPCAATSGTPDPLLERLHKLTRSDCTTRNKRRAAALSAAYDDLEDRIEALREQEEIDALRPELDGYEIGAVLGIPPGPDVGRAYRYLLELRLDAGPIGKDAAAAALRQWAAEHGVGLADRRPAWCRASGRPCRR